MSIAAFNLETNRSLQLNQKPLLYDLKILINLLMTVYDRWDMHEFLPSFMSQILLPISVTHSYWPRGILQSVACILNSLGHILLSEGNKGKEFGHVILSY